MSLRLHFVIVIPEHLRDREECVVMKVIANLGLCISVYDIRSIDGDFVFPGDGASTYTVCVI